MVTITIPTKLLYQTLRHLKVAIPRPYSKNRNYVCEITVVTGKVTITLPGATFNVECETIGTCKATFSFLYFMSIINSIKDKITQIRISDGEMTINEKTTIDIKTTFFEDDKILRTIKMPMNFTDAELLRLEHEGYTWDEVSFNKLTKRIAIAERKLKDNLFKAFEVLRVYGVTYEELEKFTKKHFTKKNDTNDKLN